MYIQGTAFLRGKEDALAGRRFSSPFDPGSEAAMDYAEGYTRGLSVLENIL